MLGAGSWHPGISTGIMGVVGRRPHERIGIPGAPVVLARRGQGQGAVLRRQKQMLPCPTPTSSMSFAVSVVRSAQHCSTALEGPSSWLGVDEREWRRGAWYPRPRPHFLLGSPTVSISIQPPFCRCRNRHPTEACTCPRSRLDQNRSAPRSLRAISFA